MGTGDLAIILPNSPLITESGETAAIICIAFRGACGEGEFRLARFGKRQIIVWEGRRPSGLKESICAGYGKFSAS
jgi:hypothetical protein